MLENVLLRALPREMQTRGGGEGGGGGGRREKERGQE